MNMIAPATREAWHLEIAIGERQARFQLTSWTETRGAIDQVVAKLCKDYAPAALVQIQELVEDYAQGHSPFFVLAREDWQVSAWNAHTLPEFETRRVLNTATVVEDSGGDDGGE